MSRTTRTCYVHVVARSHFLGDPLRRGSAPRNAQWTRIHVEASNHVDSTLKRTQEGWTSTPEPMPIRRTRGCVVECCSLKVQLKLFHAAEIAQRNEPTNWDENKPLEQESGAPYFYFEHLIGQFRTKTSEASHILRGKDQQTKNPNAGEIRRDSRHCRDRSRLYPSLLPPLRSLPSSSLATKAESKNVVFQTLSSLWCSPSHPVELL